MLFLVHGVVGAILLLQGFSDFGSKEFFWWIIFSGSVTEILPSILWNSENSL